jgi:hypothetical protein
MLLKNVIGPVLLEALVEDVNNNYFSLIIDESTDISVNKYLCLCIKYFSEISQKVLTNFLGIIEVERVTADCLYTYRVSQKWRTNGVLRCRRDYRKRQKNVKKKSIGLI